MSKKKLSTNHLFEITAEGFAQVHSEIAGLDKKVDHGFELVLGELKDIKETNRGILIAVNVITEHAVEELRKRLEYVEKKVGIER